MKKAEKKQWITPRNIFFDDKTTQSGNYLLTDNEGVIILDNGNKTVIPNGKIICTIPRFGYYIAHITSATPTCASAVS